MSMPNAQLDFIHRFTPGADASQPTLLLLHGTGGDESDMIPLGMTLAPKAALLSPRGKVLENGMNRFFRRLAEGVFDLDDLKYRTHELAEFVEAASRAYHFDLNQVVAVGFSNGANIAASALLLRPGLLRAAVLFCPTVPLVPQQQPDLDGTLVFIGAGRSDPIVRPEETERLMKLLRDAGAQVSIQWQPGGHSISNDQLAAVRDWLPHVLEKEKEYAKG